jgi:LacI family gluconate utilization system Gnt-I transcriptional repressor
MNDSMPQRRRRKMQRVTMTEVARAAQVSPSTVSLFLRKPDLVSPAIGEAIARVVDELGYVPNLLAGGLAAAGSRVVSIIVPSVRNAFFADTVAALQDELGLRGMQLMLGHTEYSAAREEALVRTALSWSPAAIVLVGLEHSRATKRLLLATDVPVFEIWECGQSPADTAVGFHHREVGLAAAHHLLERGRRRLAFLGARGSAPPASAAPSVTPARRPCSTIPAPPPRSRARGCWPRRWRRGPIWTASAAPTTSSRSACCSNASDAASRCRAGWR